METKEKAKIGRPKNVEVIGNEEETKGPKTEVLEKQKPKPKQGEVRRPTGDKKDQSDADRIAESRKALEHPLPLGQQFFEAPDGEILIGEADKTHMWNRRMNGGKGGWINPKR